MRDYIIETHYATGRRHVERAALHASNGRMDWAFGSLRKAQRSFDKGVARFSSNIKEYERNPFIWEVVQSIAASANLDIEEHIMRGIVAAPPGIVGGRTIKYLGFSSRVLKPARKPNLIGRFIDWLNR